MNLSIAEVRRRLPAGTLFNATFLLGPIVVRGNTGNTTIPPVTSAPRKVVKQSAHEMVSELLDGPKKGQNVHCGWKGVTAREENGEIILTSEGADFVKFTIQAA